MKIIYLKSLIMFLLCIPIFYYFSKNSTFALTCAFIGGILTYTYMIYNYRNVLYRQPYNREKVLKGLYNLQTKIMSSPLYKGTTVSYTDFRLGYNEDNMDSKTIPKLIFRMSKFPLNDLPVEIANVLEHCNKMNPEYLQIYLDDNDCNLFITEYFPQYVDDYQSVIPGAFKSDIIRLLLLYKYGGVYSDIGHTFLKPLDSFIDENDELVIVKDLVTKNIFRETPSYAIHNAFIAVYKNNSIILYIIKYIIVNINSRKYGLNPLDITGPLAVGKAFNLFFENEETTPLIIGKYDNNTNNENGKKIKILYLSSDDPSGLKIIDHTNNKLISTKFKGYRNVMYSDMPTYTNIWMNGLVYDNNF